MKQLKKINTIMIIMKNYNNQNKILIYLNKLKHLQNSKVIITIIIANNKQKILKYLNKLKQLQKIKKLIIIN